MPSAPHWVLRTGQVLFRFRSLTPVPVLAAIAWVVWRAHGESGPGGDALDSAFDGLGLVSALAGQALRFWTLGQVPEGTSGQGFELQATTLNRGGPYAHVRNPLYVGNFGIVLGLLLMANQVLGYVLGIGFFVFEYFFIVRAEEDFLRSRFGAAFDTFCAQVPRWFPRMTPAHDGPLRPGRFDWSRAFKKEHNPFAAWALGALAIVAAERAARGQLDATSRLMLLSAAALVVCFFVSVKAYKRGWVRLARG